MGGGITSLNLLYLWPERLTGVMYSESDASRKESRTTAKNVA